MSKYIEIYNKIEDYDLILGHVNFDLKDNNFTNKMGLKIGLSVSDIVKKESSNILTLSVSTNVSACENEKDDVDFFDISIVYDINILLSKDIHIDIDNKSECKVIIDYALVLLHPELRSMINSIVNRLGLPNIDIPLKVMKSHGNKN